jgi:hypothetical protein
MRHAFPRNPESGVLLRTDWLPSAIIGRVVREHDKISPDAALFSERTRELNYGCHHVWRVLNRPWRAVRLVQFLLNTAYHPVRDC